MMSTIKFKDGDTYLRVPSNDVVNAYPESETFNSSQLGLELLILPTGEVVDIASTEAVLIDDDYLDECEQNIVDWIDAPDVKTAHDFRGEAQADWEWIVRAVRSTKRPRFPIVRSKHPGSVNLTGEMVAEYLEGGQ